MKKVVCLLLVMAFALTMASCGVEIPDNNGPDDDSLASITTDHIVNLNLGASAYSMSP